MEKWKIQNCEFRIRKSDFISRSCKFISRNLGLNIAIMTL